MFLGKQGKNLCISVGEFIRRHSDINEGQFAFGIVKWIAVRNPVTNTRKPFRVLIAGATPIGDALTTQKGDVALHTARHRAPGELAIRLPVALAVQDVRAQRGDIELRGDRRQALIIDGREQIKTGKPSDADVLTEPGLDFLRPTQQQFPGNAAIIQSLFIQFDAEFVTRSVVPESQILAQVCEPFRPCLHFLAGMAQAGADAILFLSMGGAQPGQPDQLGVHLGLFNHHWIGAQSAFRGRQVVTFSGDGGLSMMLGDLLSLHQHKLPVKIIVFSNRALGFVELEMKAAGILGSGTELVNPDFAALAKAAGLFAMRVEDPAELTAAVKAAFEHEGPALVEAVVNRTELSMPPTIKLDQAIGFNLWALKAVMNGRGDEVIDLAISNVLRR